MKRAAILAGGAALATALALTSLGARAGEPERTSSTASTGRSSRRRTSPSSCASRRSRPPSTATRRCTGRRRSPDILRRPRPPPLRRGVRLAGDPHPAPRDARAWLGHRLHEDERAGEVHHAARPSERRHDADVRRDDVARDLPLLRGRRPPRRRHHARAPRAHRPVREVRHRLLDLARVEPGRARPRSTASAASAAASARSSAVGLAFNLNIFDEYSAKNFDDQVGVNHTYLFGEYARVGPRRARHPERSAARRRPGVDVRAGVRVLTSAASRPRESPAALANRLSRGGRL